MLIKYICKRNCGFHQYVFEGDETERLQEWLGCKDEQGHKLVPLPPNPVVAHATFSYMTEVPILDCVYTLDHLDAKLTAEVRAEKELNLFNKYRRENQ